jgi:hypothetical protein
MAKTKTVITPAAIKQALRQPAEAELAYVLRYADDIFDRHVDGESFSSIAKSLPFKIPGWRLRELLLTHPDTEARCRNLSDLRAHAMVEQAIEYGRQAAHGGDFKTAIDVNLKVAAKLAPREYADKGKLELTGKDGGPLEVKADLTLTAEQAYERLIKGK